MRKLTFYQLDVFTSEPFAGNPLAVFTDAEGLTDAQMQMIAREMNLSETVFVLSSERALRRLRIFTPKQELPLAGHPVVGTWNLLAQLGVTPQAETGRVTIEQELNIGVLPVEIEFAAGRPARVVMTQGRYETGATITDADEIARLAEGLGLGVDDLHHSEKLPIQVSSTGIKALDVPVRSLDALGRININSSLLAECYLAYGAIGCYAFCFETREEASHVHARFYAPDDGIAEDPATGSAAGSLAGYLIHHGALETNQFVIEQGDFIQRPSRIHADVAGETGRIDRIKIGGASVLVAQGEVFF